MSNVLIEEASTTQQHEKRNYFKWRKMLMDAGEQTSGKMKKQGGARQGLGRTGERLAAEKLVACEYRVLERNFRCCYGEIDLVAEHEGDLVFIEVKTRRGSGYGLPEEAVTLSKQRKIVQVASYYLDLHKCAERSWRIDVVAVQMSRAGKLEEIRVYQHACTEIL